MSTETITLKRADARVAYNNGDASQKKMLTDLMPGVFGPIMERIKDFAGICAEAGVNPQKFAVPAGATKRECMAIADDQVDLIYDVINDAEGWTADFADGDQEKWCNWYRYVPGSGFRLSNIDHGSTYSYVGARRSTYSEAVSRWIGETFIDIISVALGG